jgi:DNA-binding NtrC family response regulator
MPGGMTGRELADELKKKKPGLKVIYTSGFNSATPGRESTGTGDTVFLAKPYLPDAAAKLIRTTLDASAAKAAA